ncbi:MAG: hypothetical protein D3926_07735, partial [Desulfobacteraceae bacterium]
MDIKLTRINWLLCVVVGVSFMLSGCAGIIKPTPSESETQSSIVASNPPDGHGNEPITGDPPKNKPDAAAVDEVVTPAGEKQKKIETRQGQSKKRKKGRKKKVSKKAVPEDKKQVSGINRAERAKAKINRSGTPAASSKTVKKGGVSFNFDNADLYEVIRTMADILKINYIFDININGKVTIHTAGELSKEDLMPLFFQILELNGLAALKEGNLYKITSINKIPNTPILARYGRDLKGIPSSQRLILQIIPLDYIRVTEVVQTLTPFLSESGTIIPREDSDILMVIDKRENLSRILNLVDILDVDMFDKVAHRFFRLEHMDAKEAAKILNTILVPYLKVDDSQCSIITIERLNTLVAITSEERVLEKLALFIDKMDTEEDSAEPRIFIYMVRNSNAADLASLLNQVFKKEKKTTTASKTDPADEVKKASGKTSPELFPKKNTGKKKATLQPTAAKKVITAGASSSKVSRDITIIADETRNALIIEAVPSDYLTVKKVLKQLDILPRQVLINVLILDITHTDSSEFGAD